MAAALRFRRDPVTGLFFGNKTGVDTRDLRDAVDAMRKLTGHDPELQKQIGLTGAERCVEKLERAAKSKGA
ncbi:hypothetical protein P5X00_36505 [Paraburkholderia sp. A2RO-4L]|uniref:hypothetical protein n=1 Tax=Paraburkholderia sp. A2RO-4L TaxID=3028374 RepID=UPI0032F3ED24|nr:hypothetical protein [Burkholderia vietnamiensis]